MSKKTTDIKIEKLGMEAKPYDKVLAKVAELCPAAVQNGKVDFERLKAELADVVDESARETYEFKWVGKNAAMVEANKPIRKTLRPCKEESKNWDTTENLYIEGDNLEVLKLLEEGYLGKIKMIYIDPPYNTGNDFVYHDNRVQSEEEMNRGIDLFDEEDNRLLSKSFVRNTESSGRFHSDWCSMMYPRLKLARDLLTDDGVIFISIDDNEVANLKKICDEVFGEDNFVANFIWKGGRRNASKYISTSHEYVLCFAKNLNYCSEVNISWHEKKKGLVEIYDKVNELTNTYDNYDEASQKLKEWYATLPNDSDSKAHSHYSWIDENGVYFASDISRGGGGGPKWEITNPYTGQVVKTPQRGWAYSKIEDLLCDIKNNLIHFNEDGVPCKKRYLKDNETQLKETVFYKDRRGSSKRLKNLMNGDIFPFPKDEEIISNFLASFSTKDDIVLDFFSGSATTAHAVMQLNAEDGGNRKFIMVQLPEETDEKSEAYKAGYKNICEIGKERIRRAGDKIVQETGKTDLDIGFRVLKVDDSNMQDVYYKPSELKQADLLSSIDNIKADRTPLDLLFGVMVEWGVSLSLPLQEVKVGENTIHIVGDNDLVACFDRNVSIATITKMAELNPTRVVFRDSCFEKDDEKINMFEIFKTICHWDDKQAKDNVRVM